MMDRLPDYLQQSLRKQYGDELAEQIAQGMAEKRRTSLRVNTLKSDAGTVAEQLTAAGIAFEKAPFSEDAFLLTEAREKDIWALPMYEKGEVYLQSLSSMLPPLALAPQPGTDILDMALPRHSFIFLRKGSKENGNCTDCVKASDFIKRNTDSLKNAVENDLFSAAPSTDLLYDLLGE